MKINKEHTEDIFLNIANINQKLNSLNLEICGRKMRPQSN